MDDFLQDAHLHEMTIGREDRLIVVVAAAAELEVVPPSHLDLRLKLQLLNRL